MEPGWCAGRLGCSLLPESCSLHPSEIAPGPASFRGSRGSKGAPSPSSPPPSRSVPFDVKVPGEPGLCHCGAGGGRQSGASRQIGNCPWSLCCWTAEGPGLPQTPASHQHHLKQSHQSEGCVWFAPDSGDSLSLQISSSLTLALSSPPFFQEQAEMCVVGRAGEELTGGPPRWD